jgi:hypothetical protein
MKSMTNSGLHGRTRRRQGTGARDIISINFNILHNAASRSALALLVAAILADDPYHTLAPYDLAVTTDTLDRSAYFHVNSPSLKSV